MEKVSRPHHMISCTLLPSTISSGDLPEGGGDVPLEVSPFAYALRSIGEWCAGCNTKPW